MRHITVRLVLLSLLLSAAAVAGTLNWTVTGLMTGSLGGSNFNSQPFSLTLTYDPSQDTLTSLVYNSAAGVPGSVSISGVGGGAFTALNMDVFLNTNSGIYHYPCPCGGFSFSGAGDIFDFYAAGLGAWDMQSPIGPMGVTYDLSSQVGTTGGQLVIGSASGLTLQVTASGVPEPAAFALTGLGLAVAAFLRRKAARG